MSISAFWPETPRWLLFDILLSSRRILWFTFIWVSFAKNPTERNAILFSVSVLFTGKYTIRLAVNQGRIQSREEAIYRNDVSTNHVLPLKSDSVNLNTLCVFSYLRIWTAWTISKDMTLLRLMFILDQGGHCWAFIEFRQQGGYHFVPPLLLDIVIAWSCKWIIIRSFQGQGKSGCDSRQQQVIDARAQQKSFSLVWRLSSEDSLFTITLQSTCVGRRSEIKKLIGLNFFH